MNTTIRVYGTSFRPRSIVHLGVLDNANLGRSQCPSVELETLLLSVEASTVLLVGLRRLENGLVNVGVELLCGFAGVESLQAVLLKRVDEDGVGHLDTVVESNEVAVVALELLFRDSTQGAVKVVNRFYKVASEALDGEVFCGLDLTCCAFLEVAEVGDRAEVFVLQPIVIPLSLCI